MPIFHHDIEQRSEAWHRLRLGIPTASNFDKIVTASGSISKQRKRYAYHLIAERLLNRIVDSYTSPEMERGTIAEGSAVDWYEYEHDVDTTKVGFITNDAKTMGCSPDRLIGDDGLLEIKCPGPAAQVEYLCTGMIDSKYKPQTQGQLFVSERRWVDIVAWTDEPELPKIVIRTYRDDKFLVILERELQLFNEQIETIMERIRAAGTMPQPPPSRQLLIDMLHKSLGVRGP